MKKTLMLTFVFFQIIFLSNASFAKKAAKAKVCKIEISSNDAMKFDKTSITVKKSCTEITVNLKHTGKLPKNVMGHNWALSLTKDMQAINTAAIKAGPKKDYTPTHKALIAVTPLIGGGKSTSVTFDSSKL